MYPDKFTNKSFMLDVGDGHTLFVHDWGNKNSKSPFIYLHGGPGGYVKDRKKLGFNPEKHRVIFFDQRGCGGSQPSGSLKNNTTDDLMGDITKIADHLKLETFILTGGSWGSCLALVYAIRNPERVQKMILDGIFTGTQEEIDWMAKGHFKTFFPDAWERFIDDTPKDHKTKAYGYHTKRILGENQDYSIWSSVTLQEMESSLISLDDRFYPVPTKEGYDTCFMRLETHYMTSKCFLPDNYILKNAGKLTMPIWLIQGRYDMMCPPITAWNLHKKLPNSKLKWTMGGHAGERSTFDVYSTILETLEN